MMSRWSVFDDFSNLGNFDNLFRHAFEEGRSSLWNRRRQLPATTAKGTSATSMLPASCSAPSFPA